MLWDKLFPYRAFFTNDGGGGGGGDADAAAAKAKADADAAAANKDKTFDYEYVERLRREAADARQASAEAETKRKTAQDALDKIEREKLEAQGEHKKAADLAEDRAKKAEERADTVQKQADQRYIDAEIKLQAQAAGMIDPADALVFLDREGIKLEGSEVQGVAEAITKLQESKKHLFKGAEDEGRPNVRARQPAPTPRKAGEKVDAFGQTQDDFNRSWDAAGKAA